MKKIIMMLLGVVFATGASALDESTCRPYSADTNPAAANASWYSCYFLDLDNIKAATANSVTTVDRDAYANWLKANDFANFAANTAATKSNASFTVIGDSNSDYDDGDYGFYYTSPRFERKGFLAVLFFDNDTNHGFQVVSRTGGLYYGFDDEISATGWIAAPSTKPQDPIEYLTWDADAKAMVATNTTSYTVVTKDTATFEDKKWYVVTNTIERAGIKVNGEAHLILCDGAKLTVKGDANKAGIEVAEGKSLTIYGQSEGTGKLEANGGFAAAGIGGSNQGSCGTITINGGAINATSGDYAAGVGGAYWGSNGATITINAGEIEAAGGQQGAGIGSGNYYKFNGIRSGTDLITINGGKISAIGGEYAAGIGSGSDGFAATVAINGGTITASTKSAEAIGQGDDAKAATTVTFGEGVEVSIKAGDDEASATATTVADYVSDHSAVYVKIVITPLDPIEYLTWDESAKSLVAATNKTYEVVTAETATFEAGWYIVTNTIERAGIKVNGAAHLILCDGASLTVTGAEFEAGVEVAEGQSLTIYGQSEGTGKLIANGGTSSTGIGGKDVGTCGTITINGGTIKATGGSYGAGIGSGSRTANAVTITINGGEIEANGGLQGAGIGAGNYHNYGGSRSGADTITINGGTITATGGQYGAGIGGGSDGFEATITINGGKVKSTGGDYGAGIGSGDRGKSFVTIAINGGEIDAIGGLQGAGIGSGNYFQFDGSRSGTDVITINGGTIQATGGQFAAGIGSGTFGLDATVAINGGAITASTTQAEAIGIGYSAVSPTTVTFGEGMGFRIEAGVDSATAEVVSTADFAEDHSAAYASCTSFDPVNVSFPAVAGLKYTVVVDGEEYVGAISGETYTVAVPNGSTVTITYSPANSTITLGTGITNPVTLTNITEAKAFTKADLPSVTQTTPISYLAWDDEKKELYTELSTNFIYEVVTEKTQNLNDGFWYVVNTDVERGRIKVNGSAHLILCDGASLKVTGGIYAAGVEVAEGCALTIYGQSEGTGKLEANGGKHGAGIGGNAKGTCGTITINGGTIAAISSGYGAGIGGSAWGSNGATITINGGNIEAVGGKQGAGIGSGNYYQFDGSRSGTDVITINGGTITATGGQWGAGIGSGSDGLAATVTINGGTITASTVPDQGAEAIGKGADAVAATTVAFGEGAEVSIKAGDDEASATATTVADYVADHSAVYVKIVVKEPLDPVEYLTWDEGTKALVAATNTTYEVVTADTATFEDGKWYVVDSTIERAGIIVDGEAHLILCDGASLKVTGGAKEAGIEVPADKSLTIYGQSEGTGKLEANGGNYGAGIGGKNVGTCGTITINGGTIKATGGNYGAGIGSGDRNTTTVAIVINGGEIEATGGAYGAGIGSGSYVQYVGSRSGADTITLNGGVIKTIGGFCAAGIGNGAMGLPTEVTINGGTITASTTKAQAIGSGYRAVSEATVTFGTAMASKYVWAGESATKGETMTTTAFAADQSAAYAELPVETYEVAYDANGATGTMSNSVFAVAKEVSLTANAFAALGYDFAGWATNSVGDVAYDDEATGADFATTNATLSLYARWNANTNGVTATDYETLTNMIATAAKQGANLPIMIDFTSDVKIDGAALPTLPTGTGFDGLKYVGDDEGGSNLELKDGVLYGSAMRGEVTVDALVLMQLANGGTISSFQAITEGETTVTNAVVMLLGDDGKAYFNDTDDVDQMIADILAADPRPTTVKLYEVKGAMVTFEAMGGTITNGLETITYLCLPDTGYVLPDEVEREGYTLKGWFDSWKPGANEITNNQVIVDYAPQSLYAQWTSTAPTPKADELHISDVTNNVPVTEIAAKAYVNKTSVKTVTTPLYLKKICNRAFMGCTALEKLTITATRDYETLEPTKVTIEQNAFSGCTSLEELLIAGDIEKIGQSAFQNCAKLKKIIFRGDEAIAYDPGAFYRCGYANGTDELKVYMSSAFQAANAQLISDFQAWNTQVKIIDKIGVEPVTGETTVSIDPAGLVAGKRVAIVVQTSVKGTPDKEDVDIELSTDLATWTPITEGVEKTAYPDGTVMIEITVPNAPSAFFRAVVKEN